jgi:hypothetical protein
MWKSGRRIHSWGVCVWSVRDIAAILMRVHFHISVPSPHSVIRWMSLSFSPHILHWAESVRRIPCNLSLVSIMSWITIYQLAFMASDAHVVCRSAHTLAQSVVGWGFVIRLSVGLVFAMHIGRIVSYTLRRNALGISPYVEGSIYTISRAYIRKYSSVDGILPTSRGFPMWSRAIVATWYSDGFFVVTTVVTCYSDGFSICEYLELSLEKRSGR